MRSGDCHIVALIEEDLAAEPNLRRHATRRPEVQLGAKPGVPEKQVGRPVLPGASVHRRGVWEKRPPGALLRLCQIRGPEVRNNHLETNAF